jgi:hypothetical protein
MEEMLEIVRNNFSANRVVDAKFTKGLAWLLLFFAIDVAVHIGQVRRSFMFDYVNHPQSILLYGQAARAISIG